MKKLTALMVTLLIICPTIATAQKKPSLTVTFQGLIAFVPSKIDSQPVLWALLGDGDYEIATAQAKNLPPCVADHGIPPPSTLRSDFPPHVAAMRISNAKVLLDGKDITGLFPAILLKGRDIQFTTGKKIASIPNLVLLANADELLATRGGKPDQYAELDKVNSDYLTLDSTKAVALPFLTSRVKIDFGERITENSLVCGNPVLYGFTSPATGSRCFFNSPATLAETVTVTQSMEIGDSISVDLMPAGNKLSITPNPVDADIKIEIMNVMPKAIADTQYDPCDDKHQHEASFRWYYRFLKNPTPAGDCSDNFFPCEADANQGGTKCPLKGLVE